MTVPIFAYRRWRAASPSHWAATAPSPEDLRLVEAAPPRAEFVIVGTGLAGASVALSLRERGVPADEIVLLEAADRPAWGATGRNGGFVLSFPGPEFLDWRDAVGQDGLEELVRLNIRNREMVRAVVDERGLGCWPGGSWTAADSAGEEAELRACLRLLDAIAPGAGYAWFDGYSVPNNGYRGGIVQPADFGVHPVEYTQALLELSGARVACGCPVDGAAIREGGGGVEVPTPSGTVRCSRVVLAANAYLPLFFGSHVGGAMRPARNQVMTARIDGETTDRLWGRGIYYADRGYVYFRQFADGLLLLGGARNIDPHGETSHELEPNPPVVDHLERSVLPRLTGGRGFTVGRRWQGIMAFSPDGLPLVGPSRALGDRAWFLGGFTGYGLGFHRVAAETVVGAMLDGTDPGVFSADRVVRHPPSL